MPFLRNTWYVFGYADDITPEHFGHRTIVDQPVLVYRRPDGTLAALRDVCPHRFVPLHMGRQIGDAIQCGYHGLRFGPDGACVGMPIAGMPIPKAARVTAYPVVERHSLVWLWTGDPALADAGLIPDFSFLCDPARGNVRGYTHVDADYQLAIDNLSDLTHVQFLHAGYQASEAFERLQFKVDQVADTVYARLTFPNGRPPYAFQKAVADIEAPIDLCFETRWNLPSCVRLRITAHPAGAHPAGAHPGGDGGNRLFESMSAHILTPETERSAHYFFVNSRDYAVGDPEIDARVRAWQRQGFDVEDKPMLEAQQRRIADHDIMTLGPVLLPTDAGAIRVRRILAARMKAEGLPAAAAERGA